MLSEKGFQIETANDGQEALIKAKKRSYDLFLLNIVLPKLSGIDLCREIRKFDKATPILMHSGLANEAFKLEAKEAGAQGYLVKPNDIYALADKVEEWIDVQNCEIANAS
jgi:DNA-binding response OmpR family regulator